MKAKYPQPTDFGYYWVEKTIGGEKELVRLYPGKQYQNDNRSVEVWECPGIGRYYLDLQKMPKWSWTKIEKP